MKVSISKSEIKGKVIAPSSKSYTIRGLAAASLAKGTSEIIKAAIEINGYPGIDYKLPYGQTDRIHCTSCCLKYGPSENTGFKMREVSR